MYALMNGDVVKRIGSVARVRSGSIPPDWRIEKTYLYLCYV